MLSVIYSDRSSSFLSLWSWAVSSLLSGSATQLLFFFPVTMFYFCKWQLILFCVSLFSFHDVLFFFLVFQFLLLCLLIFSNVHYFFTFLTSYFSVISFPRTLIFLCFVSADSCLRELFPHTFWNFYCKPYWVGFIIVGISEFQKYCLRMVFHMLLRTLQSTTSSRSVLD